MDEKNGDQLEKPDIYKVYFKPNLVKGEEESHCILIQRPIHQKDMKW